MNYLLKLCLFLLTISSVSAWMDFRIGNTILWWTTYIIMLILLYKNRINKFHPWSLILWIIIINLGVLKAVFTIESYWDWKLLIFNFMAFNLCIGAMAFANPNFTQKVLYFWFRYLWWLIIPLAFFMTADGIGKYLSPYCFLALFYPILQKKQKRFVIISFLVTLILAVGARSDQIKFIVCLSIGLLTTKRWTLKLFYKHIRILQYIFLLTPIIFFSLGISGIFNIFRIQEELKLSQVDYTTKEGNQANIYEDTRTWLYTEEIESAINNNYILWGRTPARGFDSPWFSKLENSENRGFKRANEREHCEVSILNIFNYWGIIGVIAYFLVFFMSSYYAINKSNNLYIPIIGLYVAFRWTFAWIEDFSQFDLNMTLLWMMIGICYSPKFRNMTNLEFKNWIKSLLYENKKYYFKNKLLPR